MRWRIALPLGNSRRLQFLGDCWQADELQTCKARPHQIIVDQLLQQSKQKAQCSNEGKVREGQQGSVLAEQLSLFRVLGCAGLHLLLSFG